jgi:hypothetical protein
MSVVVIEAGIELVPIVVGFRADETEEKEDDSFHGKANDKKLRSEWPAFQLEQSAQKYDSGTDTDQKVFEVLELLGLDETHCF